MEAQTTGPEKGWLIIHGGVHAGGTVSDEIKKRFVALAGGRDANFVLIPTALSDKQLSARGTVEVQERAWAKSWGINHVRILHTRDKPAANSEYFIDVLRKASGVWIMGGRQWRLADAYLDTAVEREIKALLERAGVVGGSSAGASIQASFLVRGDSAKPGFPDGDNRIMVGDHKKGFGLLTNSAIDQHLNPGKREDDLVGVIEEHPDLLGLGIYEGTAIVVHGGYFEVLNGQVAIYGGNRHNGASYYTLSTGQTFGLRGRCPA